MSARAGPSRVDYSRRDLRFESAGTACAARLYLPDRPRNPRLVVLAPGLVPDARTLRPVATRYAERGYAALCFDPRCAGESGGQPRGLVDPARQRTDWRAAVARGRRLDAVPGDRPVLRGADLAGAVALEAAAAERVGAVVAAAPLLDGRALRGGRGPRALARLVRAALRDRLGARPFGVRTVPAVGPAGDDPLAVAADLARALDRAAPGATREVPARSALALLRYRAGALGGRRAPALVTARTGDPFGRPPDRASLGSGPTTTLVGPGSTADAVAGAGLDAALGYEFAFLADSLHN